MTTKSALVLDESHRPDGTRDSFASVRCPMRTRVLPNGTEIGDRILFDSRWRKIHHGERPSMVEPGVRNPVAWIVVDGIRFDVVFA